MYKVDVLPITKSAIKDSLSYFSSENLSGGTIVSVPVRNKNIKALVVGCISVHEDKASLKELPYSLKKLTSKKSGNFLRKEFIEAASKTATYHATFIGQVLSCIIPQRILENPPEQKEEPEQLEEKTFFTDTYREPYILQAPDQDRFADYKSCLLYTSPSPRDS